MLRHAVSIETGGSRMNRVTRMGIGLVALIPVLGIAGAVVMAAGVEGAAAAWMALGIGLAWIGLVIWWALRAPAQIPEGERGRYTTVLRHAEFHQPDQSGTAKSDRR